MRYYCWNNVLEESVLNGCTPEIKSKATSGLPYGHHEGHYQSYTALSVKYPEVQVESKTLDGEVEASHDSLLQADVVRICFCSFGREIIFCIIVH